MPRARSRARQPILMRRIALVTPMLPVPHDQTRGRYIHETARALSRIAEVRVYFMQLRYPSLGGLAPRSFLGGIVGPDYTLAGLDVETFTYPAVTGISRAVNGLVASRALTPRACRFRPDLMLAYWVYPDGFAAMRTARRLGIPCVVGALGSDIHVRSGISQWLTRRTIAGADALLTVSEAMRKTAIDTFSASPAKVHTIVNGFNTEVFHPRDRVAMRARLGIAGDVRLIAYVGRFVEAKGLHELLQAFEAMSNAQPDLRLALIGDGVMRAELVERVRAGSLAGRVLMPGGLEPSDVAAWLCAADLLTLPSWSEGYPNVVVEALACGIPVVATDVGGTREIIDAQSGLLIPARDARALQAALERALATSWDAVAIASRMRRSWDEVAAETLAVCENVLASRADTARIMRTDASP